jgi:ribosomal protein S18 acetylase RimI-like enzyme
MHATPSALTGSPGPSDARPNISPRDRRLPAIDSPPLLSRVVRRNDEVAHVESRTNRLETWAVVVPQPESAPLTPSFIQSATGVARQLFGTGIRVLSPAVTGDEMTAFANAGYSVRTQLHLLTLDMRSTPKLRASKQTDWGLQPFRASDTASVLGVDSFAFAPGAEMDELEFQSALRATPKVRVRVVRGLGYAETQGISGYALFGRAQRRGYIQRLAVRPDTQGQGIARMLMTDGLKWFRRTGVRRVVVNTERGNERALGLYDSIGFRLTDMELVIMENRSFASDLHRTDGLRPL